ncbi:MAG: bifunctional tetrahydrofolate synthase/dihydrofolate synthase [Wigglesworthia glossinidia]|nr:bifunctional tetrahydrofolate synthase/dihydrofolate synthase [Wigglesworthia glossinidia]
MKYIFIPNNYSKISDWIKYIENIHYKEMDFRLDAIYHIASNLGLLQPAPIAIIVGGTNGKGSTCRLIEAILLNSKKTVGVYSSPHLLKYNERIRVQGLPISNEICILAISYINKIRGKISISYFEFSTLVALWIFKYLKLDVVILEVGLGGSLDATNIVNSNISVITNVALEHTQILGGTYDQIAKEKSGIFRSGKIAIFGDVKNSFKLRYAAQIHKAIPYFCNIHWFWKKYSTFWMWKDQKCTINLPYPNLSVKNAATALAVIQSLPYFISYQSIIQGLKTTLIGRFQIINKKPLIILDVAHNPHAASFLSKKMKKIKKNINFLYAIVGMLRDKDIKNTLKYFLNIIDVWYCVSLLEYPRGAKNEELSVHLCEKKSRIEKFENVKSAWEQAIKKVKKNDCILVFGSFYTISSILNRKINKKL